MGCTELVQIITWAAWAAGEPNNLDIDRCVKLLSSSRNMETVGCDQTQDYVVCMTVEGMVQGDLSITSMQILIMNIRRSRDPFILTMGIPLFVNWNRAHGTFLSIC